MSCKIILNKLVLFFLNLPFISLIYRALVREPRKAVGKTFPPLRNHMFYLDIASVILFLCLLYLITKTIKYVIFEVSKSMNSPNFIGK